MLDPLFYPYFGGTEKVVLEVGKRLVKNHGHEVDVLTSMIPQANGVARETIGGMSVRRTPSMYFASMPGFLPPPFTLSPLVNLEIATEQADSDIFHIHNRFWYFPGTLALIKLAMKKKLMLTIHNSRPRGLSPELDRWGGLFDDTMGRLLFRMCDRINCVSQSALADTIPASMHAKSCVTYNGVDTSLFTPGKPKTDVRRKFGIGEGPLILSNGRLITQKGFPFLIEAFADVKQEMPDARLLIIGKGPLELELLKRASSLGLLESIFITTGIPEAELPDYYRSADVFVLPSLYEPFGLVSVEAMACGKPVVTTRVGGNPEVVSDDAGYLVPPRDHKAIAEKMLLLLGDDSLRKKKGAAARNRAVEQFDWDVVARQWDASYKSVI